MGTLRTKMEQNLRARGLSPHTSENYLRAVEVRPDLLPKSRPDSPHVSKQALQSTRGPTPSPTAPHYSSAGMP